MSASRPSRDANYSPSEGSAAAQPQAWGGVYTLLYKELLRFWKVSFQTIAVGLGVVVLTIAFAPEVLMLAHPLWAVSFALLGSAILCILGLIAGIWSDKFDQLAAFQNFIIIPLTFLSGVFYSIHSLPPLWQGVSHFNPFFYMIDGFRYGFFGLSDVSPLVSLAVVAACAGLLAALALAS